MPQKPDSNDSHARTRGRNHEPQNRLLISESLVQTHAIHLGAGSLVGVARSPDGSELALVRSDRIINRFEVANDTALPSLAGHTADVTCVAWAPEGHRLASGSVDESVRIWNLTAGKPIHYLSGHEGGVCALAWSPDGSRIATADSGGTVHIWSVATAQPLLSLSHRVTYAQSLVWARDGSSLYTAGATGVIRQFDASSGRLLQSFSGHRGMVESLALDESRGLLFTGGQDRTIRIWNTASRREVRRLEGHTGDVCALALSPDGQILASQSLGQNAAVFLWRTDTWELLTTLNCLSARGSCIGFHTTPNNMMELLTVSQQDNICRIIRVESASVIHAAQSNASIQYTNAKIVLVGDTGVGKSALGLALAGQPFTATDSTHARHVWTLAKTIVPIEQNRKEQRELLLWDLAGQPGYRLIHQLHLSEVAVALVVFTASNEIEPFAGVRHWDRALRQAQRSSPSQIPVATFLVAARIDVGGSAGAELSRQLAHQLGYEGYFATSAKEGVGIVELRTAVEAAIPWDALPKVSSTALFQEIRAFLLREKASGRILITLADLYQAFRMNRLGTDRQDESTAHPQENSGSAEATLHSQFETCVGLLEAQDLIRRLSFGGYVLLQPEALDAYASALVNAVRDEPNGLGSILENRIVACDFAMPTSERLHDRSLEQILLIAMIEDLLRLEIALRESTNAGTYLVFPSLSTRSRDDTLSIASSTTVAPLADRADETEMDRGSIVFIFEGPTRNIYATLVVRLANSGLFKLVDRWRDGVNFQAQVGGKCSLELAAIEEGRGQLTLVFDQAASEETRYTFEEYVATHLQRHALPEALERHRIIVCDCGEAYTPEVVQRRRDRNFDWLQCIVCDQRVDLRDGLERLSGAPEPRIAAMDRAADNARDRETLQTRVEGRRALKDFDVFLSYNSQDKSEVRWLAQELAKRGVSPWFDERELRPGFPFQRAIEEQIQTIPAAAVICGAHGLGSWQDEEAMALLTELKKRDAPIIVVILPSCMEVPNLPPFLQSRTWVSFKSSQPDPFEELIWGITGKRAEFEAS